MTTGHDRGAAHPANRDTETLRSLGYKQELNRTLGLFSNFAVAFSYLSVSTGIFSLFALGIQTGGPAFFWSWPLVCLGQLFVALSFAELASHYPLAGSVYQWSKRVASPGLGWMIGWFYLGATILTITAVAFTLSQTLPFIFNWPTDANTGIKIALVTILICTIVNISGVRLLAMINNTGVAAEIIGMVVFALVLLVASHHQSLSILVNTAGTEHTPGAGSGYVGVFLSAMFMSLFVVYGFDAAGTVAEETVNAQKEAPRSILIALGTSFVAGGLFLIAAIMAIKNLPYIMTKSTAPLQDIINGAFGSAGGKLYLAVASIAIFVCAMSVQAACRSHVSGPR